MGNPIWLTRVEEGIRVDLGELGQFTVTGEGLEHTRHLSNAAQSIEVGACVELTQRCASPESIQKWNVFRVPATRDELDASDLLQVILVADFLGDDSSVRAACAALAAHADAYLSQGQRSEGQDGAEQQQQPGCDASDFAQVLSHVPPSVAELMLTAAPSGSSGMHHSPDGRFRALLATVPAALHDSLLRAHHPSIDGSCSLSISRGDAHTTAAVMHTAASTLSTQLTSLCFHGCVWAHRSRGVQPEQAAAPECITYLSRVTALQDLQLADADVACPLRFVPAFADALLSLTGLTRLNIRGIARMRHTHATLLPPLRALRMLRSLDIGGCRFDGDADLKRVADMAPVLCALSELTHLSLAHNPLGAAGWGALAPAAASLPLRRLELQGCMLSGAFRLCGSERSERRVVVGDGGPLFSALTHLDLSGNGGVNAVPDVVGCAPSLAALWLEGVALDDAAVDQLCGALSYGPRACMPLRELRWGWLEWTRDGWGGPTPVSAKTASLQWTRHADVRAVEWLLPQAVALISRLAWLERLSVSIPVDTEAIQKVPNALAQLPALTALTMNADRLLCGPLVTLLHGLGALTTLRSLEVGSTRARPVLNDTVVKTAEASGCPNAGGLLWPQGAGLGRLVHLERLQLTVCMRSDVVWDAVCCALACMPRMQELAVRHIWCPKTQHRWWDMPVLGLLPVLSTLRSLRVLDLQSSLIHARDAQAVAGQLHSMRALRVLRLQSLRTPTDDWLLYLEMHAGMLGI